MLDHSLNLRKAFGKHQALLNNYAQTVPKVFLLNKNLLPSTD